MRSTALYGISRPSAVASAPRPSPGWRPSSLCLTAFTLSLAAPDAMAARAREASAAHPLLKLKLGGDGDTDRLAAVRAAVPQARLIVDANEAWQPDDVESLLAAAAAAGVELVEQPLPAGGDDVLARIARPVPVCADEFGA